MTNDLQRRIYEHKNNLIEGFTKKYNAHKLVYYGLCNDVNSAILREKRLKKWYRKWKIELIEESNPEWKDLSENFFCKMDSHFRGNDKKSEDVIPVKHVLT